MPGRRPSAGTPVKEEDWSLDMTGNWTDFFPEDVGHDGSELMIDLYAHLALGSARLENVIRTVLHFGPCVANSIVPGDFVASQNRRPDRHWWWQVVVVSGLLFAGCDNSNASRSPQTANPAQEKHVFVASPSREVFSRIIGVNGADAPNDMLLHWIGDGKPETGPIAITAQGIRNLQSKCESFDCTPYIFDDTLKRAVAGAPHLKWLSVQEFACSSDLEWICELRQLRGLSLRDADLRRADLGSLQNLSDLQWLDLSATDLRSCVRGLPQLPRLEVLLLDSGTATDADLPFIGQFPELKVLSLTGTAVTDAGLRRVVEACPHLRFLHLSRSEGITAKSFSEVVKLKQLEYMHVGSPPLERFLCADNFVALRELQRQLPRCYHGIGD